MVRSGWYLMRSKTNRMKNPILVLAAFIATIFGCNPASSDKNGTPESSAVGPSSATAMCIWKEVAIRDSPSEKAKYLTSVYLGEKLQVLADTSSETVNGKLHHYQRIKLGDGMEGWIRTDFIAKGAEAAQSEAKR